MYFMFLYILCLSLNFVECASPTIVGGSKAPPDFGLFHASLQNLTGHHVCGSAVVSNWNIVTAAHCVFGAEPQYIKVIIGTIHLDLNGRQYDVESITIHDDYNTTVLRINEPFDYQNTRVLRLGENNLQTGDAVTLSGRSGYMSCKYLPNCRRSDSMTLWIGDSGGPLVKDNELDGVVSWGIPCAVGFPDVHTRISSYVPWCRDQIHEK